MIDNDELEVRFSTHEVDSDQKFRMDQLRTSALVLADSILDKTPVSREQSLALTALEEVIFWTSSAIARREGRIEP